ESASSTVGGGTVCRIDNGCHACQSESGTSGGRGESVGDNSCTKGEGKLPSPFVNAFKSPEFLTPETTSPDTSATATPHHRSSTPAHHTPHARPPSHPRPSTSRTSPALPTSRASPRPYGPPLPTLSAASTTA